MQTFLIFLFCNSIRNDDEERTEKKRIIPKINISPLNKPPLLNQSQFQQPSVKIHNHHVSY